MNFNSKYGIKINGMELVSTVELKFICDFENYLYRIQYSPYNQVIMKEFLEYVKKYIGYIDNPVLKFPLQLSIPYLYRICIYSIPYENSLKKDLKEIMKTIFDKLNIPLKSPYETITKNKATRWEEFSYVFDILSKKLNQETNLKKTPIRLYIFLSYILLNREFIFYPMFQCNVLQLYQLCLKIIKSSNCRKEIKKIADELHSYIKKNPKYINKVSNIVNH